MKSSRSLKILATLSVVCIPLGSTVASAGNPMEQIPTSYHCSARDYREYETLSELRTKHGLGAVALDDEYSLWKPGKEIKIVFIDGSSDLRKEVAKIAKEWTEHANIEFVFDTVEITESDIAISFNGGGNKSSLGSQSRTITSKGKPSMNLEDTGKYGATITKSTILHEFGHALGLHHEHMSPSISFPWNKTAVFEYYKKKGWKDKEIRLNIYDRATTSNYSEYDPQSIMHYQLPAELFTDSIARGRKTNSLSKQDKEFISKLYPASNVVAEMEGIYRSAENYIYEISRYDGRLEMREKEPDGSETISFGGATQRGRILIVNYSSNNTDEVGYATLELLSDNRTLKGRYYRLDENKTYPMSIKR